jgi:hypothetical protein
MANTEYLNLITSQHKIRPKFMAWLMAVLAKIDAGATLAESFTTEFDLNSAVGAQLDIIGEMVGVSRTLESQPSSGDPVLSDDDYRFVIRAKIVKNQWDGTLTHLFELWAGTDLNVGLNIIDNQNMTMTVKVSGMLSQMRQELISAGLIVPKPQSVGIIYELNPSTSSFPVYIGIGSAQYFYYQTKMEIISIQTLTIPGVYGEVEIF